MSVIVACHKQPSRGDGMKIGKVLGCAGATFATGFLVLLALPRSREERKQYRLQHRHTPPDHYSRMRLRQEEQLAARSACVHRTQSHL
jgi:hypothetical protein